MKFSDRKDIIINNKTYTLRQRCLSDVIMLQKASKKYMGDQSGAAVVLAASIRDAMKYDNYRINIPIIKKFFRVNIKWVMKRFTLAQLQEIQSELFLLQGYGVKKKQKDNRV